MDANSCNPLNDDFNNTTQRLLAQIQTEFEANHELHSQSHLTPENAARACESLTSPTVTKIAKSQNIRIEAAIGLAKKLGTAAGIAQAVKNTSEVARMVDLLGQLQQVVLAPDADEKARISATTLIRSAQILFEAKDPSNAAISLMNAGVSLSNVIDATPKDLETSEAYIDKSLRLKRKHGTKKDVGYSLLALGRTGSLAAEMHFKQDDKRHKSAWNNLRRGASLLLEHENPAQLNSASIAENLVDAIERWTWHLADSKLVEHFPNIHAPTRARSEASREQIREFLYLHTTSAERKRSLAWATSQLAEEINYTRTVIERAHKDTEVGRRNHLLWFQHKLNLIEGSGRIDFTDLKSHFNQLEREHAFQLYFTRALSLLGSVEEPTSIYVDILSGAIKALQLLQRDQSASDIKNLVAANCFNLRVASTELGLAGRWEQSFTGIEMSKTESTQQSENHLTLSMDPHTTVSEGLLIAHLTHSPRGIVYVSLKDGIFNGQHFPIEDMRSFSELFHGFDPSLKSGLVVAQAAQNRTAAIEAADQINSLLCPVADHIADDSINAPVTIIIPGGYLASFPIQSVLTSDRIPLSSARCVSVAPSLTDYLDQADTRLAVSNVSICISDNAPMTEQLKFAALDVGVVRQAWPNAEVIPPIKDSVLKALSESDAFHYSGHSTARLEIEESAIALYDSPLRFSDLDSLERVPAIAFLSSCQSGLSHNTGDSEALLSFQSLLFGLGAKCVIGTSWNVQDIVAHVFSQEFYKHIAATIADNLTLNSSELYRSFRASTERVRDITVDEVDKLLGIRKPRGESGSLRAFPNFYDWAAFTLMLRF